MHLQTVQSYVRALQYTCSPGWNLWVFKLDYSDFSESSFKPKQFHDLTITRKNQQGTDKEENKSI